MLLRAVTAGFALVVLVGCDKQPETAPTSAPPANSEFGRWIVVPAGAPIGDGQYRETNAWRLDTKTGALEFCTYTEAIVPTTPPTDVLECSQPATASPQD